MFPLQWKRPFWFQNIKFMEKVTRVKVIEYLQKENYQASHLFADEWHTQHTGQFNTLMHF